MDKKKVLVWADSPTSPTGWGTVVRSISKFLKEDFNLIFLGINYNGDPHNSGFKIYPPATKTPGDLYGYSRLSDICEVEKPDIIFMINDIWVINQMLEVIKIAFAKVSPPRLVAYFPVDADDHDPLWYKNLHMVNRAVVYNAYGKQVAEKARKDVPYSIIGHGVDSEVFFRAFQSRRAAKERVFHAYPEIAEKLVILSASRNQPRKRLDMLMRGYADFVKDKDDVLLYMHCGITDAHINVQRLAGILGISDKIIVSPTQGLQQLPVAHLNLLYNACDIGINTALGEGFGLPSVEHAITGAVQIVPDNSVLSNLWRNDNKDCAFFIPAEIPFTMEIGTTGKLCTPEAISETLERAYSNPTLRSEFAQNAAKKFFTKEFEWETVANEWRKLLMSV